jgi:hypothetical protein
MCRGEDAQTVESGESGVQICHRERLIKADKTLALCQIGNSQSSLHES